MRLAVSLFVSWLLMSVAVAAPVGVVSVADGPVQILRADNYLAAAPGVELVNDDIVETGKRASAQLDMGDGSVLKLGPDTRLALSDYKLDSNRNIVSATLDVMSGWLRFAVSKLKPEGRYNFNTPVLTIGVRGTEGTIEAENEQGGLHLEEGAVDVTPFGQDLPTLPPVRVVSGEFIQRLRGQPLAKLPLPPAAFKNRLPPVMQQKLVPRVQELKQRGVTPKIIRPVTRDDAKRMLERHPHLNDKLRERFKPLGVNTPPGAARAKDRAGLKEIESDPSKDAAPGPGFGGQVLRERQLKGGKSNDPKDVSEGLRQRLLQRQEQGKAADQRLGDKLQQPPPATPKHEPVPGLTPTLRDKSSMQPLPGANPLRSPLTDKPLLQKPPADTKQEEPEQPAKPASPLRPSTSPLLQQRIAPATTGR